MSERWACRLVKQPRGTQRYQLTQREEEEPLTDAIGEFASQYGRYCHRRITAPLRRDGWQVGKDGTRTALNSTRAPEFLDRAY